MATEISKVIFQLDIEAKEVITELEKVAGKYRATTAEVKKQEDEIEKLTKREKELTTAREKANNPNAIVKINKELKVTQDLLTKEIAAQKSLNKELDHYDDSVDSLSGKLESAFNKQILASFEQQLADIQAEQVQLNNTISDKRPANSLRDLKIEYKELIAAAIQAGEETDIGRGFLKQAGEVKDRIGDIQDTVSRFASDTGVFDGIIGGVNGLAAGFEVAQGAAALFGNENEDVQKALLKVNAAMAIANGLQQIQALLQKESAFRIQATTVAQRAYNVVVGQSTGALKVFKIALAGTGIGLAIIGIQKLIENFDALKFKLISFALQFGNIGMQAAQAIVAIDQLTSKTDDSIQDRIDAANLALAAIERNSNREVELAKANGKETAFLLKKKTDAQILELAKIQGFLIANRKELTKEQVQALADFVQDFADAENANAVASAEAAQQRVEADKKANKEIIDLRIALIKDERQRQVAEINIQAERRTKELNDSKASKEKIAEQALLIEKERIRKIEELEDIRLAKLKASVRKEGQIRSDGLQEQFDANMKTIDDIGKKKDKIDEDDKKRVQNQIEAINIVTQATIDAAETVVDMEIKKQNALFEIQNKRVQQAALIAERGNAELLQQEQERLDAIQKKREAFVRAQQILQQVEIVGNSIVAVSKAAAQGGVAAPATIAATIAALIAGYALVRTLTQPEGFREGGYTGDGDPSQRSRKLGDRGYTYHKKEFVFNEDKTRKHLPTFMKIHRGELDLNATVEKARMFDQIPMPILNNLLMGHSMRQAQNNVDTSRVEKLLGSVDKTLRNKPNVALNISEKGFRTYISKMVYEEDRIKNKAR